MGNVSGCEKCPFGGGATGGEGGEDLVEMLVAGQQSLWFAGGDASDGDARGDDLGRAERKFGFVLSDAVGACHPTCCQRLCHKYPRCHVRCESHVSSESHVNSGDHVMLSCVAACSCVAMQSQL